MEKRDNYRIYYTNCEHLEKFLDYIKIQKNYSLDTVISYQEDLIEYLGFCNYYHFSYLEITYKKAQYV